MPRRHLPGVSTSTSRRGSEQERQDVLADQLDHERHHPSFAKPLGTAIGPPVAAVSATAAGNGCEQAWRF